MIGQMIAKDLAKRELEMASGGMSARVLGPSRVGQAAVATGAAQGHGQKVQSARQGNIVNRNVKPKLFKQAGWQDAYKTGLATAAAGTTLAAAGHGAAKLYGHMKAEKVWKQLQKENPQLTNKPKDREYFEALKQFSPDIASNITTARTYMQRIQNTNMIPHEFVKDLANIQKTREDVTFMGAVKKNLPATKFDFAGERRLDYQKSQDAQRMQYQQSQDQYTQERDRLRDVAEGVKQRMNISRSQFEASEKEDDDTKMYRADLQNAMDENVDIYERIQNLRQHAAKNPATP